MTALSLKWLVCRRVLLVTIWTAGLEAGFAAVTLVQDINLGLDDFG